MFIINYYSNINHLHLIHAGLTLTLTGRGLLWNKNPLMSGNWNWRCNSRRSLALRLSLVHLTMPRSSNTLFMSCLTHKLATTNTIYVGRLILLTFLCVGLVLHVELNILALNEILVAIAREIVPPDEDVLGRIIEADESPSLVVEPLDSTSVNAVVVLRSCHLCVYILCNGCSALSGFPKSFSTIGKKSWNEFSFFYARNITSSQFLFNRKYFLISVVFRNAFMAFSASYSNFVRDFSAAHLSALKARVIKVVQFNTISLETKIDSTLSNAPSLHP